MRSNVCPLMCLEASILHLPNFRGSQRRISHPTAKKSPVESRRLYIVVQLSPARAHPCIKPCCVVTSIHLSYPWGLGLECRSCNQQGDASLCTRTRNTKTKQSSILLEHGLVVRPQKNTNPQRAWVRTATRLPGNRKSRRCDNQDIST